MYLWIIVWYKYIDIVNIFSLLNLYRLQVQRKFTDSTDTDPTIRIVTTRLMYFTPSYAHTDTPKDMYVLLMQLFNKPKLLD